MIEVQIVETKDASYAKPHYEFDCPMCELSPLYDFDRSYVRNEAWMHLISEHRVLAGKINLVVVNVEALPPMQKVAESTGQRRSTLFIDPFAPR